MEGGLDGTYPIPVHARVFVSEDPPAHLTFVLTVPTESGVLALRRGCLRLRSLSAKFSDGSSVSITAAKVRWWPRCERPTSRTATSGVTCTPERRGPSGGCIPLKRRRRGLADDDRLVLGGDRKWLNLN